MTDTVTVGVVAAEGVESDLAEQLAEELPDELGERYPGVEWRVEVSSAQPAEPSANSSELIETVRRRVLDNGWQLGVGLTDLPLRSGSEPVTALASATHGVGLVSVPALGAIGVEERLKDAVADMVVGLLAERSDDPDEGRLVSRLAELGSPLGSARVRGDGTVRFAAGVLRGNLRLLVGMVRANQPARVIVSLSRALVGSLGTGAFAVASSNVWTLADGMTWPRLLGLGLLSVVATCLALVLMHGLWERARDPAARERVMLFNMATVLTIALGVLTTYLALLAISALAAASFIPPGVLEQNLQHAVGVGDYAGLAWLVATIATIGGALGSMVESDLSVRSVAYRYRDNG
jgi:hypothetical protein